MSGNDVEMLRSVFPAIPEEPIRRALEITGSAEAASEWFLENDWRELETQRFTPAEELLLGGDDDDDEDEEDDDDLLAAEGAALAAAVANNQRQNNRNRDRQEQPPAKKRKTVRQEPLPPDGATSFWATFDATVAHKSHLQLMNLRPRTLGHSRIVLSRLQPKTTSRSEAETQLADVWSHLPSQPGYWLVPILANDVDDVWWKILEPHLLRNCFSDVLIFQTVAPLKSSSTSAPTTSNPAAPIMTTTTDAAEASSSSMGDNKSVVALLNRAYSRLPRFDDVDERQTAAQNQVQLQRGAPTRTTQPAACVVIVASGTKSELKRIGDYLAALFPGKTPLYFRSLKGTAGDIVFANDPRADPDCLHPDWHAKHADLRVTRVVNAGEKKLGLFPSQPRTVSFIIERRNPKGDANDWRPYDDDPSASSDGDPTSNAATSNSNSSSSDGVTTTTNGKDDNPKTKA